MLSVVIVSDQRADIFPAHSIAAAGNLLIDEGFECAWQGDFHRAHRYTCTADGGSWQDAGLEYAVFRSHRAELALAWARRPARGAPSAASRTSVRRSRTAARRAGSVSLPPSAVTT